MSSKNFYTTDKKNFPAPYKRRRYYTPQEVKVHNTPNDCWVSFFHEVYDITELIQKNYSHLVDPIIKNAGTDITHWFDEVTRDVSDNI
jgi:cytochrome b involved in lipid metabolism